MATSTALTKPEAPQFSDAAWQEAGWLPCNLSVEVRVPTFSVRDLLLLEVNSVIETRSVHSADVPVRANSELVGWAEFEVVGSRLAIRMTELA